MSSRIARSSVVHDRAVARRGRTGPSIALKSRPSATSLIGEVELVAGHEVDRRRGLQAAFGVDRDLGADEAGLEPRIGGLQRLDRLHVGGERRRRGVQHDEIEVARLAHHRRRARCGAAARRSASSPRTRAAGWASQVGYQNERISRLA